MVSFGPSLEAVADAHGPFRTEPNPILRTFPESVAVADVEGSEPLVVVSVYGLIDRGYADTTIHRILSDLTPLVDERRARRMVIAGDLNRQNDCIFVTADILERKPVLTVFDEEEAWELGGHCPLAIEWHEAGARWAS